MNQIIYVKDDKDKNRNFDNVDVEYNKINNKKRWFRFQFLISVILIISTISMFIYYINNLSKKEKNSVKLINNYKLYKLYAPIEYNKNTMQENDNNVPIFGTIEIPKINLYYPIFSSLSEEQLKISPCKFYGDMPDKNGNICIAGHNYDNSLFFSNLNKLSINDEIKIITNLGITYRYFVTEIYEVKEQDLTPIFNYDKNKKNLTLITCNNINLNRIVFKAQQKSF